MFLSKRIKELREERHLLQRQLAASLEIDTPMYSKIERGERKAKREQVIAISKLLEADENELLILWLSDKIIENIREEALGLQALIHVENELNKSK